MREKAGWMKKLACLSLAVFCLLFFCGCGVDWYAGQRPALNADERWVSEAPEMYFTWDEERGGHLGEITINGVKQEVLVLFDYGKGVNINQFNEAPASKDRLFRGQCKFGKNKLEVAVVTDDKDLFDGDLPVMTFVRQERQEDGTWK